MWLTGIMCLGTNSPCVLPRLLWEPTSCPAPKSSTAEGLAGPQFCIPHAFSSGPPAQTCLGLPWSWEAL
jgi:hypothetical protein